MDLSTTPNVSLWTDMAAPARRSLFTGAQSTDARESPRASPEPFPVQPEDVGLRSDPNVAPLPTANTPTIDNPPSVWDTVDSQSFMQKWGGSQRLTSVTSLALITTSTVTTSVFAPRYSAWNKTFSNSVPGFAETMKDKYPAIHAALAAVPSLVGSEARIAFMDAFEALCGTFGGEGGAKELFLVAVSVWVLLSTKSNQTPYLNLILQLYLWLPDTDPTTSHPDVASLQAAVLNPQSWAALTTASSSAMALFDVHASVGFLRLNPLMHSASAASALRCKASWNDLLGIILDAITFSHGANELESLCNSLKSGAVEHDQQEVEPIIAYIARIEMAFLLTCNRLRALNKDRLVPTADSALVPLALAGCKPSTLEHFRRIWIDAGLNNDDLTAWDLVKRFLLRAGGIDDTVLQLAPPRQPPGKPAPPRPKPKDKGADFDAASLLPLPPSVVAMRYNDRLAQAYEKGVCTNCLGAHHSRHCPHVRCDGKDWHPGHAPNGDSQLRPQVPGVAAPATVSPAPLADSTLPATPSAVARAGITVPFSAIGVPLQLLSSPTSQ